MPDLYQSQRAMRQLRQAAMQRGLIAVIDVGTSKVSCFILRFDSLGESRGDDGVGPLAGQARFRVIGAATTRSRGVRRGEIVGMQEAERAIRTVVQQAQKQAGQRVDHVIACLSGGNPRSYGLVGEHQLADNVVTEADIGRVLAACDMPDLGAGREVLHAQPVNFQLDHRSGLADPRGQIGHELACDMHLLSVDGAAVTCLVQCLRRCDLEVAGIASSAYAAGLAALVEGEQELGSVCIDMGGGTTGISIFYKRHMIHADTVPLGGEQITGDIAYWGEIAFDRAEQIKTLHGGVHATSRDDREMIRLGGDSGDWDKDSREISRGGLIGVIRPRVEEILEEVRLRLEIAGFNRLPSQQIVLTGGGSQLPGINDLAAWILGAEVRLGRPLRVGGQPQQTVAANFAAIVGLCLFSAHPQDEWWDFAIPAERYPARSLRRAMRWFRDNW